MIPVPLPVPLPQKGPDGNYPWGTSELPSGGYFDTASEWMRMVCANLMMGAGQSNDLITYRAAAVEFLLYSPPGLHTPVFSYWTVLTPKGNLLYIGCAAQYSFPNGESIMVETPFVPPDGCGNPLKADALYPISLAAGMKTVPPSQPSVTGN